MPRTNTQKIRRELEKSIEREQEWRRHLEEAGANLSETIKGPRGVGGIGPEARI